jgi:hypothetical protein
MRTFLLCLLGALAGCDSFYFPSMQEREAKAAATKIVGGAYAVLPDLPKVKTAYIPYSPPEMVHIHGNYLESGVLLLARFYTPLGGEEACRRLLQAIKQELGIPTLTTRGECAGRRFEEGTRFERTHFAVDARKPFAGTKEMMSVSVDISERGRRDAAIEWLSDVQVSIYYKRDSEAPAPCTRDGVMPSDACVAASWGEGWVRP